MKCNDFLSSRKIFAYFLFLVLSLVVLFLSPQNLGRSLFIQFVLIIWILMNWRYKFNLLLSSLAILALLLPFNVTIKIPDTIRGFTLYEPYVMSVRVIYLIPVISVIDLGVVLIFLSLIFENRNTIFKRFGNIKVNLTKVFHNNSFVNIFLFVFAGVLFINLIKNIFILKDFIAFMNNLRFLFWISTGLFVINALIKLQENKIYKKFQQDLSIIIILISFVQVFIALFQFRNGHSVGADFLGESELLKGFYGTSWVVLNGRIFLRGYGTFPHPNIFAAFLNLLLIKVLFTNIFTLISKFNKYIRIGLALILLVGVSLTLSRTGLVVAFVVILLKFFSLMFKLIKNEKKFAFGFISIWSERLVNLFKGEEVSFSERIKLARISIKLIKENFVNGVGWGKFISAMGKDVPKTDSGHILFEPVHNIFLLILAENGVIFGSMIIFGIMGFWFGNLFRSIRSRNLNLLLIILSLGVWFIIGSNFDHYFWTLPQGILMTVIFISAQYLIRLKHKFLIVGD